MMHKVKWLILWCVLFVLISVSCTSVPQPLPTPRVFLSPVSVQYLPLASRPNIFGRGGALTHSSGVGCEDARKIGARWVYNWTQEGIVCPDMLSLPMTWHRDLVTCPKLGSGNPILLWNEPSNAGAWGNAITPDEAVALTRKIISCYPNRQFATPAEFAGQGNSDATVWLTEWWNGYILKYNELPPISYMATHCYAGIAQACIDSLTRDITWANERNLPILLTEWGIVPKWAGSEIVARTEADKLLHFIQQQPEIIGEAFFSTRIRGDEVWWFGGPTTSTIDIPTGSLTAWGQWYAAHQ